VGVSIAVDQEKLFTEADKTRKVKITNGKVREYKDNKGVDKKEIRAGKIEFLDTQKKTMNDTKESSVKRADDGERWLEKDRQIAGQAVAKSLIEAGFSEPTEQTLDWATAWCVWIDQMRQGEYNGQTMEELQRKQDVVVPESEAGATGRDDKIKRIHILKGKLEDDGYWVEDDYRLWLADEFEVQNSKDLTDEQKTKAIEILAKWLNERLKREE